MPIYTLEYTPANLSKRIFEVGGSWPKGGVRGGARGDEACNEQAYHKGSVAMPFVC